MFVAPWGMLLFPSVYSVPPSLLGGGFESCKQKWTLLYTYSHAAKIYSKHVLHFSMPTYKLSFAALKGPSQQMRLAENCNGWRHNLLGWWGLDKFKKWFTIYSTIQLSFWNWSTVPSLYGMQNISGVIYAICGFRMQKLSASLCFVQTKTRSCTCMLLICCRVVQWLAWTFQKVFSRKLAKFEAAPQTICLHQNYHYLLAICKYRQQNLDGVS